MPATVRLCSGLLSAHAVVAVHAVPADEDCNENSWIGGITEICDGVLVYRDYGADRGAVSPPVPRAPPAWLSGEFTVTDLDWRFRAP